jgi:anti-sigma regulatory factor (Ser/Thr protein kinase)
VGDPLTLHVVSSFDAIPAASEKATAWLEAHGASPAVTFLANLAIEELVTNCIKYGYADTAEHVIDIELDVVDGQLVLRVIDDGEPFNPLEAPAPDTSLPPEDRPIGGLGLHLLRTMSDNMTYERRDGRNRLTLMKAFAE